MKQSLGDLVGLFERTGLVASCTQECLPWLGEGDQRIAGQSRRKRERVKRRGV